MQCCLQLQNQSASVASILYLNQFVPLGSANSKTGKHQQMSDPYLWGRQGCQGSGSGSTDLLTPSVSVFESVCSCQNHLVAFEELTFQEEPCTTFMIVESFDGTNSL